MESRLLVYQCKNCRYVVSDSSFLAEEDKDIYYLTDAVTALGPDEKFSSYPHVKIYPAMCQCKANLGVYVETPPIEKPELRGKYLLDKEKLLRYVAGRGFLEHQQSVEEKIKDLREKVIDLNCTQMLLITEIVRLKEVVSLVANDPKVMNLMKPNWLNKSSDVDNM